MQITTTEAKALIKNNLRRARQGKHVVALHLIGPPGCGKSSIAEQAAKEYEQELGGDEKVGCFVHFLANKDSLDIKGIGMPAKSPSGRLIMNYTDPCWALPHGAGKSNIVFFDEYLQAEKDAHKASAEVINAKRVEHYSLPAETVILMASNRAKDRSGANKALAFLQNRYEEVQVKAEFQPWHEWALENAIPEVFRHFAEFRQGIVFPDEVPAEPGPYCTARSYSRLSTYYGDPDLTEKLFLTKAIGMIGEGAAAELIAYIRTHSELPKFEEIVANPKSARMPSVDKADAMHACMMMLVERVDRTNADKVFMYLDRMPEEFRIAGVKHAFARSANIVQCAGFGDWLSKNSRLIMAANIQI